MSKNDGLTALQKRTLWLEQRRTGLGGSDAAAICGVGTYSTALEVYLEKIGSGFQKEQTAAMDLGHIFEALIQGNYETLNPGIKILPAPANQRSKKYPWMISNYDGVAKKDIYEYKSIHSENSPLYRGTLPNEYWLQGQHYLAVSGSKRVILLVGVFIYNQPIEYREPFIIERDEETIEYLIKIESDFWHKFVLTKTPPPLDFTHKKANELLSKLYPMGQDLEVELPSPLTQSIERLLHLGATITTLQKEVDSRQAEIKDVMKDATYAHCGDYKVSWKGHVTKRLDIDSLKSKNYDIYQQFVRETASRRFTIKLKEKMNVDNN